MSKKDHHHSSHASDGEVTEEHVAKPASATHENWEARRSRMIQARAYSLWERDGKPGGDVARDWFWCEAEREIAASELGRI